jgi:ubiquinone/menaquinone biosynthesis C-methylase UbiE
MKLIYATELTMSVRSYNDLGNFDWRFYCNYYADLKSAGIDTEKKAVEHYIHFGQYENRLIHPDGTIGCPNTNQLQTDICLSRCSVDTTKKSFFDAGEEFYNHIILMAKLKKGYKILDVGCGMGRITLPLTKHIKPPSLYYGLDIDRNCIEWCRSKISVLYPNFNFNHVSNSNTYSNDGMCMPKTTFPYDDNTFDVIFATSVFTHLLPDDARQYLSEIGRVLKIGGKCIITYFLWNPIIDVLIKEKKTDLKIINNCSEYKNITNCYKEKAIAYPESLILQTHDSYKLPILEILYGSWSGNSVDNIYQDIVFSEKVLGKKKQNRANHQDELLDEVLL